MKREERCHELKVEEDIMISGDSEKKWKDIPEENHW